MRILIAEDEAISRRVLESILTKQGYMVIVTCDGAQACEEFSKEGEPLLAILDVMMPGINGIEVCRRFAKVFRKFPPISFC